MEKFPFSSNRKMMSRIVNIDNKNLLLVKGGAEIVIKYCSQIHFWATNEIKPITPELKKNILDSIS